MKTKAKQLILTICFLLASIHLHADEGLTYWIGGFDTEHPHGTYVRVTGNNIVGNVVIPSSYTIQNSDGTLTTLPVKRVGQFSSCEGMTSISIPGSVNHIEANAFLNCTSLTSIVLPSLLSEINSNVFKGCTALSSVYLPSSITHIGNGAFEGCLNLSVINLPDAIDSIGQRAFMGCSSLQSLVMPHSLKRLGHRNPYGYEFGEVFKDCINLSSVVFNDSITEIYPNSFENCTSLTNIIFPSAANVAIRGYAFKGCTSLTEITFPEHTTSIGVGAFDSCVSLTTIYYNRIGSIFYWSDGYVVFDNCPNVTRVIFGDSVNYVLGIFQNLTGVTSITIPKEVKKIANNAFANCTNLDTVFFNADSCSTSTYLCNKARTVVFGNNVKIIPEGVCERDTMLTSIVIPDSVVTISYRAFKGCSSLKSVIIPNSVRFIQEDAFGGRTYPYRTLLDTVFIGSSLEDIQTCGIGLSENAVVHILAETPPAYTHIGSVYSGCGPFGSLSGQNRTLHIPCGTLAAYQQSFWNHAFGGNLIDSIKKVSVFSNGNGTVEVLVSPTCDNDTTIIHAMANSTYRFSHWSDGDTANPRTLVLTQDTILYAFFKRNCDEYFVDAPYVADFTECWASAGNAYIDSLGRGAVSGQSDTLFSPWMNVDSDTYAMLRWVQTDASASPSVWYLTIRNREGEVLQNHWMRTDYQNQRWWIGDCAGQEVRFEFTHSASEAQPAEFAVTEMKLFSYHLRTTVNGPDTVYVGDTATFNVLVDQESNSTLFYSWYIWDGGTAIGSTGQTDLPSFSVTWDEPGVYRVYNDVTAALYNQPVVGYQSAIWTITRYITVLDTTPITPVDCDSITLPYFADFTQCWTATGGATIINSNLTKLDGYGQTLTSPWILLGDEGSLFYDYWYYRDTASGVSSWEYLDDGVQYSIYIRTQDGTLHNIMIYGDRARFSRAGYRNTLGNVYNGQLIQVVIKYEETSGSVPVFFSPLTLDQSTITATITAPVTASVGDTVVISGIASLPAGAVANESSWWITNSNGDWLSLDANDSVFSVVFQSDSCQTLVWHMPGQYEVNLHVSHGIAYARATHSIFIIDTVTVDCDSIALPYSADFMQCWSAEGGATIIDPNHVSLTSQGQKLTGPWMESVPGKTFFDYHVSHANNGNWNENIRILLKIESEEGVVTSWESYPSNGWGNYGIQFNSPGGRIRLVIEYTGSQALSDFSFGNVQFYSYQIENAIEGPGIVYVGDTVTFTAHATLQDDEVADYYDWYMYVYNSNGSSWVDENDPSRTIVSRTDSTLVVVWNTPGRYSITSSVYKYNVYHNSSAYADDRLYYIKVVDYPFYEEDSIYYTSTAKDTVIGCHPQLHNALLPEGVTVIADSAFFNLSNLSSVSMPDGLEYIGKMAFAWNQGLTEITLPRDLQYIGDNAFWWDTNITVVNFNAENCLAMTTGFDDNGNYYPAFIGCNNLTTIHFGERVKRIPDFAFGACYNLTGTLVIPDSVTYIGSYAFNHWRRDNPRLDVVLGRSVSEIGEYAFWFFHHDNTFTIRNANPPSINQHSFDDENGSMYTTLFVPCGSKNAYQNAPYWRGCFADIIEDCNGIEEIDLGDDIKVYVDNDNILVSGANGLSVNIYDVMGRRVGSKQKAGNGALRLSVPTTGVYLVKIGDYHAQKVVVCW